MIARALTAHGVDSDEIFRRVDLDPAVMKDPNARYPVSAMTRLWRAATVESGDPCFGLAAVEHWQPTSLHALGFAWLASSTLREAIERLVRYGRMVSNATQAALVVGKNEARIVMTRTHANLVIDDAAVQATLALIVHLARMSCGPGFHPRGVYMRQLQPPPECVSRLQKFFNAPLAFNARDDALVIDAAELDKPLTTANIALAQANDRVAAQYLARFDRQDVEARLRAFLLETLPSGAVSEVIAAQRLQMSRRSLQRKLHSAGTSFTLLLEATRRELALQYLHDSSVSVSEVAYLLGFAEAANFTRAFRRWHGMAPREYRQSLA